MAAFVVAPEARASMPGTGTRLHILPGSATPAVFAAGAPFWIGYGFAPAPGSEPRKGAAFDATTRFELDVDGDPVRLDAEPARDDELTLSVARFDSGLPPGWHRFGGRWYVEGRLLLSSDTSIEFVEP